MKKARILVLLTCAWMIAAACSATQPSAAQKREIPSTTSPTAMVMSSVTEEISVLSAAFEIESPNAFPEDFRFAGGTDVQGVAYAEPYQNDAFRSGWADDWRPWIGEYDDHLSCILPQAWERQLFYQDLCATYLDNEIDYAASVSLSLTELLEHLMAQPKESGAIFENNLSFIRQVAERQIGTVTELRPGITLQTDLDMDGMSEDLLLTMKKSRTTSDNEGSIQLYSYVLSVNGQIAAQWESNEVLVDVIDVSTCKILVVSLGYSDSDPAGDPPRGSMVYGYNNHETRLLGIINGKPYLITGEGRFLTRGNTEHFPAYSALNGVMHEYAILEGRELVHVLHGWQQANTLWLLSHDMPVYQDQEKHIAREPLQADTSALVIAYFQDKKESMLCIINSAGQCGYVLLTYDMDIGVDPIVSPGGERLTYYFRDYDGIAYAG